MSARRTFRKSVAAPKGRDFQHLAEVFYQGAVTAAEFEYWNAAGVLVVHAAIALADAVTIKAGGVKSSGANHMDVVDLLEETVSLDEAGRRAVKHLARIIEQKNLVSYSGEIYARSDVEELRKHLERFRTWALLLLEG